MIRPAPRRWVPWCQQCEPQCEPSNRRRRRAWTVKHWPISSAWAKAAEATCAHNCLATRLTLLQKTTCSHQQQMRGDIKVAANSSVSHLLNASWSLYPIVPLFSSTMWSTVAKTLKLKKNVLVMQLVLHINYLTYISLHFHFRQTGITMSTVSGHNSIAILPMISLRNISFSNHLASQTDLIRSADRVALR